jgi:Bacteriocin-protection, YdeI or OmpD-Associated/Domain of unknown function (DUF1905)
MRFRARLELFGKTATGIEVPEKVVGALGDGKRPAVRATINDYTYRSTVAVMGGKSLLPVAAEHRAPAGIAAGEMVTVDLELDTAPREVEVPDDLAKALGRSKALRAAFDRLSYTNRKEIVRSLTDAKTQETRARRLAKAVDTLRDR